MTIRAHCAFLNASRDIYTTAAILSLRENRSRSFGLISVQYLPDVMRILEKLPIRLFGSTAQGEVNDDVKKRTLDLYLAFQSQDPLEVPLISEREPRWIDKDSRRNWRKRTAKKKDPIRLCERGRWTSEILPSGGPRTQLRSQTGSFF